MSGAQATTDPSVRCRCGKQIALDVYHTDHGAYDGIVVEETCPQCGRVLSIETRIRFVVIAVAPPK